MTQPQKSSKGKRIWKWTKRIVLFMFLSSLLYTLICKWVMPPITLTQLGNAIAGYGLKRDYVSWDEISPNAKWAALASEDQAFPEHGGFDWDAIKKSFSAKPKKGRIAGSGTSTISQQVAKNVFLWQGEGRWGRGLRKIPEFYFTKLIEIVWGKKRILEVYLNVIEMGKGTFGIEAASMQYFKKHAKDLTKEQAAKIIACLPNPKRFTVVPESHWVAWKSQWILHQWALMSDDKDIIKLVKQ